MSVADKPNRKGSGGAPRAANLTVYLKPGELTALRTKHAEPESEDKVDEQRDPLADGHGTSQEYHSEEFDAFGAAFDALPDEVASEADMMGSVEETLALDDLLPDALGDYSGQPHEEEVLREAGDVEDSVIEHSLFEEEPLEESFVEPEPAPQMVAPIPRILRAPVAGSVGLPTVADRADVGEEKLESLEVREVPNPEVEVPFIEAPVEPEQDRQEQTPAESYPSNTLVGFLVSFDFDRAGDFVELRTGRLVVSCEPLAGSNCLVIDHPSVSPMHAAIRIEMGRPLQILDQLSEYGTRIIRTRTGREESLSGERGTLNHGDVVVFGERRYHVCLVSIEPGANG
jgi:hypothetical protein